MAMVFIMDFEGATLDHYDAVMRDMALDGKLPDGARWHVAGMAESGLRVIDVWDDPAAFERFAAEQIAPNAAKHIDGAPVIRSIPVHNTFTGNGAPNYCLLVTLPGLDAAGFDAVDARVRPGGMVPDGVAWHANGPVDGAFVVVDTWSSQAEHDAFAESNIAPGVADAPLTGPPQFEGMAVHNFMNAA